MSGPQRIAVIADIHGNILAFEAVLEDIAKQSVDEIVVAGDLVNLMPHPRQTWEMLKQTDCHLLQGNHEYYVYSADTPSAPDWMQLERFQPARWTAGQFSQLEKAEMRALPWRYSQPGLLVVHASERSLFDNVILETTDQELETYFPDTQASLIVRGHNHRWFERPWSRCTIVTVNACGLPLDDGFDAPYVLLNRGDKGEWAYQKRRVRYDHGAALNAMNDEYIHNVGALGMIFRLELQSASGHLMPFFERYGNDLQAGEITLRAAVDAYLLGG